jgi:DeoR/GlpR family transcriptional regulator of sugar metabolism
VRGRKGLSAPSARQAADFARSQKAVTGAIMENAGRATTTRRRKLLERLQSQDFVRVSELAEALLVSEITVRRDLDELASQGLIERVHGGARATLAAPPLSPVLARAHDKKRIALVAARFVRPGDTVLLSGGSTTLAVFREIAQMDVRIITNNAMIIGELDGGARAELFVLGGEYSPKTRALNGDLTNLTLNEIHGDICFLGTNAINQNTGLTSSIYAAATVNRLMANQCKDNVVVVADASKVGATASFVSLPLNRVRALVTDAGADKGELAAYRAGGMEVVVCDEPPTKD